MRYKTAHIRTQASNRSVAVSNMWALVDWATDYIEVYDDFDKAKSSMLNMFTTADEDDIRAVTNMRDEGKPIQKICSDLFLVREDSILFNVDVICTNYFDLDVHGNIDYRVFYLNIYEMCVEAIRRL